jgi:hypothetical protein
VALDILRERGVPLEKQLFTWKDLVGLPYSKLDNDAFTRVRVILMNGIEHESVRFLHAFARMNGELREEAARVRRIDHHQETLVNWLNPSDQSPLETTIGYEQVAIEVTASIAQAEPDPYLAQVYRFGLLEDFDHMFRYSALLDRIEGKDANAILQSYTDIRPGRPTSVEHRAPVDDLRTPYERTSAAFVSKLNALTITAGEQQTHNYYVNIGPTFADPTARALYAEIASIEEQHVTQYESLMDPRESWLEKWLLHEANEVWNYYSCLSFESDPRIKKIWQRFVDYELGQFHFVLELFQRRERREGAELIPDGLPDPIQYRSQREFVRETLREIPYRAQGPEIGKLEDSRATREYRDQLNSGGSPSEAVSAGWRWHPGGELAAQAQTRKSRGR